jgi:hypothetical protein
MVLVFDLGLTQVQHCTLTMVNYAIPRAAIFMRLADLAVKESERIQVQPERHRFRAT